MNIDNHTAQQIVDTVKDVCGSNINFIAPDGVIVASTDPARVGTYHEIGHQAAKTGQALNVLDQIFISSSSISGGCLKAPGVHCLLSNIRMNTY